MASYLGQQYQVLQCALLNTATAIILAHNKKTACVNTSTAGDALPNCSTIPH